MGGHDTQGHSVCLDGGCPHVCPLGPVGPGPAGCCARLLLCLPGLSTMTGRASCASCCPGPSTRPMSSCRKTSTTTCTRRKVGWCHGNGDTTDWAQATWHRAPHCPCGLARLGPGVLTWSLALPRIPAGLHCGRWHQLPWHAGHDREGSALPALASHDTPRPQVPLRPQLPCGTHQCPWAVQDNRERAGYSVGAMGTARGQWH